MSLKIHTETVLSEKLFCHLSNFACFFPPVDQVHQNPRHIYSQTGQTATITCRHELQDYTWIFWYKQPSGSSHMELLGYMNVNNGLMEDGVTAKLSGGAMKGQTCTFTAEKLQLSSTAVYFCAASRHSATFPCSSIQKPA
uniref:Ig-like domain-containing protein n=1 Tax=Salarias fasciatus TaxID=181472 RepID=A0A672H989_SALFA